MPTIDRRGPYRFFFYSNEIKRPHIHVMHDEAEAKIWLDSFAVSRNDGFSARELRRIIEIVRANADRYKEEWNAYFGNA